MEYELTELGHTLQTPIAAIRDWAELHMSEVVGARTTYDEGSEPRAPRA